LNRLLERDETFSQLALDAHAGEASLRLRRVRRWRSPESLLLPVGEALALLVCMEDFSNLRTCEGHACTLMFVDRTRGRARRWCSMAACGNRAKQATHRNRQKAAHKSR
jgi:predicted RNA-binding Zn ribbon-like protein